MSIILENTREGKEFLTLIPLVKHPATETEYPPLLNGFRQKTAPADLGELQPVLARELGKRPRPAPHESLGHDVERIDLVRALLGRLDRWVGVLTGGGFEDLHGAWMSRCDMVNQRIRVVCAGQPNEGRVLDVSPLDGLILCLDDGRRVHLPAASTTVLSSPPRRIFDP